MKFVSSKTHFNVYCCVPKSSFINVHSNMLLNVFQAMDDFRSDLKRVNSKLDKILPKAMLTKNVLNLEISRTRHGTLAHYNMPDANPDSKGAFMVNDNVTFFNQVQFYFM